VSRKRPAGEYCCDRHSSFRWSVCDEFQAVTTTID
jgi:hypothetical protein